uniref:Uncharacterized protein n=1 Tax=Siphoviridae sp. ctr2f5 TaxID=2825684 RepID=A0A8S5QEH6_9CAUD|nr:MAG TPA: hypothetical protein [Siphoviridae sp. ctr2f5]
MFIRQNCFFSNNFFCRIFNFTNYTPKIFKFLFII